MAENNTFIKFDPEKIAAVSANLEKQQKILTAGLEGIISKSRSLPGSWRGESAKEYESKANELHAKGADLAKALLAFSQDLAKVSGTYRAAESQARQHAESLPTDGVFRN